MALNTRASFPVRRCVDLRKEGDHEHVDEHVARRCA
jgi:hypothetical protein